MAVLYRKYRPQTFSQVLNQKFIIQTLKNQVKSGGLSHAYLFTGGRGVGKTSVARILAKAVNCTTRSEHNELHPNDPNNPHPGPLPKGEGGLNGDACGVCDVCKQIEAGNFLDLVEIDAASNTGVDNIRELIEHVKFSPSSGKYKIFIIDEVHMLSKGAFNALLKTLEEPPAHAIFILATTEINKLPATIVSRTQRFDFKALPAADIFGHLKNIAALEKISMETAVLELVAQNAEGSARDALSLLDKTMTLGEGATLKDCRQLLGITDIAVCENLLELIVLGQAQNIPEFYENFSEGGLDYAIFNRDFLEFLRKVLVYKITEGKIDFGLAKDRGEKIASLAEKLSTQDLVFIIRLFLKSYKDLSGSPNPQVPLLVASIEGAYRKIARPQSPLSPTDPPASTTEASRAGGGQGKSDKSENRSQEIEKLDIKKTENIRPEPPTVASKIINQEQEIKTEILAAEEPQMDLAQAQDLWPKVISKVKEVNGPLASMLKNSPLLRLEGGKIILGVRFMFDRQSLENAKNSGLICGFIYELSGKKMAVAGEVIKQGIISAANPAEAIGEALKVFGGELVE